MKPFQYLLFMCVCLVVVVSLCFSNPRAAESSGFSPVGPFTWNTQFFNNPTLSGIPVITRLDYYVGGDWGLSSPGLGIPSDYFSARWSTSAYLPGGTYRMTFVPDDCVRVYLDNQLVLNTFDQPRPGQTLTMEHTTPIPGIHTIQIEYRENTHTAYLHFVFEQVSVAPVPTPVPVSPGPPIGRVDSNGLNVHAGPGYTYDIVVLSFRDWVMTLLGRNANSSWLKVQTQDGRVGWVEAGHISTAYPIASLPVADGTPPSAPKPAAQSKTVSQVRKHVVQRGEILSRIALRYGVNMYTLARVNGITNLNLIFAGQVLIIP